MPSSPTDPGQRTGTQVSLGGVMIVIAFLALLLSIVAKGAQTRSPQIVVLSLGILAILAVPILILWLLIRYSPTSRDDERDVIGLVVMTLLFIILISLSVFLNRL
jgi:small-conductance mechanosensitive channel